MKTMTELREIRDNVSVRLDQAETLQDMIFEMLEHGNFNSDRCYALAAAVLEHLAYCKEQMDEGLWGIKSDCE